MGATTHDATFATYAPGSERAQRQRIASLDITRGIVMVLMAIDHVRVYAGVPAGGPTPGVFFTRWVTHFSAPGFAFLAGTGAFLLGQKLADKRALARYLVERGVILILLELTVLRLAWTFNADFAHYNLAGVIWMLGWCMILMAGIISLPLAAIQSSVSRSSSVSRCSRHQPRAPRGDQQLSLLGRRVQLGLPFTVLYVIVPWIGVMAIGYAFGLIADVRARAASQSLPANRPLGDGVIRHHRRYRRRSALGTDATGDSENAQPAQVSSVAAFLDDDAGPDARVPAVRRTDAGTRCVDPVDLRPRAGVLLSAAFR
jgi:uncharacterized membrane protein